MVPFSHIHVFKNVIYILPTQEKLLQNQIIKKQIKALLKMYTV